MASRCRPPGKVPTGGGGGCDADIFVRIPGIRRTAAEARWWERGPVGSDSATPGACLVCGSASTPGPMTTPLAESHPQPQRRWATSAPRLLWATASSPAIQATAWMTAADPVDSRAMNGARAGDDRWARPSRRARASGQGERSHAVGSDGRIRVFMPHLEPRPADTAGMQLVDFRRLCASMRRGLEARRRRVPWSQSKTMWVVSSKSGRPDA